MHEITGYLLRTGRGVCVALKMLPNGAKKQLPEKEVRKTFSFTPFFKRIRAPSFVILPRKIADSAFNMIACTGANRINYEGYAQFVEKTAQAAQRKKGKTFVLAYAEALDVACHCKGPKSKRAKTEFTKISNALKKLAKKLRSTGAVLLVTADHGLTGIRERILLNDFPQLTEMLELPRRRQPRCNLLSQKRKKSRVRETHTETTEKILHSSSIRGSTAPQTIGSRKAASRATKADGRLRPVRKTRAGSKGLRQRRDQATHERTARRNNTRRNGRSTDCNQVLKPTPATLFLLGLRIIMP